MRKLTMIRDDGRHIILYAFDREEEDD